ncbi:stAR-related lipid transfer protein 3-like [Dysidea avara]|uniref:stAR-related lipid transfer protein 3-like n=1 Tax=Dysidea avara TaxID=196820 RepID=UPI00331A3639
MPQNYFRAGFQKHFSPGATTRDHYCGFICCRIESVVVLIKAVQFDYLPKELSKYKKINWLSWQAWLWPRKLKPSHGVILEESTSRISGGVQRVQGSRRSTAPSMTTSVFVTPRTSPPYSPSVQRFDVVPEESEEIETATLSALDHSYIQQGVESLAVTEELLSSLDGWKLERQEGGVMCYSRSIGGRKKWRSESIINVNIITQWQFVYYQFEHQVDWNPHVAVAESFYCINENTDLTYVVSTEAGGGIISTRDFVTVRYWEYKNGAYYAVGKAVSHDSMPSKSGRIRGENGPGGYKLVSVDDKNTLFVWLCDTDLKGWLPQYLIDQTIATMSIQTHKKLRKYIESVTMDDDLPLSVS